MQTIFGTRLTELAADPRAPVAIAMPGRDIGYGELHDLVLRCAAWLVREGCRPGETVGVSIADELSHLIVSVALLGLGVPQVCLATHDPVAMRLRLAERLSVARVIAIEPQHLLAGRAASLLTAEIASLPPHGGRTSAVAVDPEAPAIWFTSSGTTGEPKIIALSQRILSWRSKRRGFSAGDRVLMLTSVEDYPGKTTRLYGLFGRLTSVLHSGTPTLRAQELCERLGVTWFDVSTLQAADAMAGGSGGCRFPPGTRVHASGSRVPARLRQSFRTDAGTPLHISYGAREIGRISTTYPEGGDDELESVGIPVPSIELQIVDDDGHPLPTGERGEIRVRSEGMIREYHLDPAATSRHFRDGWFHPGDVGSLTPGGSLCIHGRFDDMMSLNSIKIFPAEIERVLEEHPAVRAAAAFGIRSAVHGDIPVAAVELYAPAQAGPDELLTLARQRLGVRAPRRIFVLDALPRNATGKIVRRELSGRYGRGG